MRPGRTFSIGWAGLFIACLGSSASVSFAQPVPAPEPAAPPAKQQAEVARPDDASAEDEKKPETAADDKPIVMLDAPEMKPDTFEIELLDGSKLRGQVQEPRVELKTKYGLLKVPLKDVVDFICGLDTLTERRDRIAALIQKLSDPDFQTREMAHRSLLSYGPAVRNELELHRETDDAERARRLGELLGKFEEMGSEFDADTAEPWQRQDTLATRLFTARGTLLTQTITLEGYFGKVELPLNRIKRAQRLGGMDLANVFKRTTVKGSNLMTKRALVTKVKVRRGDVVSIRADGSIHRSGSSSSYVSNPNGTSRFSYFYVDSQKLYGGMLVARVGGSGKWRVVGGKGTFTARRDGELHLAIGMSESYATRYTYTGEYNVAVFVRRER